jgi:hypothetical protein
MSEFHDDRTAASDPLPITVSDDKLSRLEPDLYNWQAWLTMVPWGAKKLNALQTKRMIREHMGFGDSRAAIVARVDPVLLVAAYTDEQDAVLLLKFPSFLTVEHQLRRGTRLLTVNTYGRGPKMMPDIVPGPNSLGRWINFYPIIAEFVSDDLEIIDARKQAIEDDEWRRAARFAEAKLQEPGFTVRDGSPIRSAKPGKPL